MNTKPTLSSLEQKFLTACENNQVDEIRQGVLEGVDVNFKVSIPEGSSSFYRNAYIYYATQHKDLSLLPFFIEHGLKLSLSQNSYLFHHIGTHNDLNSLLLLKKNHVDLFSDNCSWLLLAIRNGHQDIFSYFLTLASHPELQSKLTKTMIGNIIIRAISEEQASMLDEFLTWGQQHPYIHQLIHCSSEQLEMIHNTKKGKRIPYHVKMNLFNDIKIAIECNKFDVLDSLVPHLALNMNPREAYERVFAFGAQHNKIPVIDYIWSKGYDFDLSAALAYRNTQEHFMADMPNNDTIDYILYHVQKRNLARRLQENLVEHSVTSKHKV